jgi:hypothetical protein
MHKFISVVVAHYYASEVVFVILSVISCSVGSVICMKMCSPPMYLILLCRHFVSPVIQLLVVASAPFLWWLP